MSDFPPSGMIEKEDSAFYAYKRIDKTVRVETEGGYVATRPRNTRPPRRQWTTGWSLITQPDKIRLDDFYEDMHGGANSFTWTDPANLIEYTVRFVGDLEFDYKGVGDTRLWAVKIKLEQV